MSQSPLRKIEELRNNMIRISQCEAALQATDYKIVKAYEYTLVGKETPYDMQALHVEREKLRQTIRDLENIT